MVYTKHNVISQCHLNKNFLNKKFKKRTIHNWQGNTKFNENMGKQHKQAAHLKKEGHKWLRNKRCSILLKIKNNESNYIPLYTYQTSKENMNENAQFWQGYGGKSLSYSGPMNLNLYNFF